jgi:hypothetical protein
LSELITRRKLITSGVVAAAGIGGIYAAARIADKYGFLAPDHQGILGKELPTRHGKRMPSRYCSRERTIGVGSPIPKFQ